MASDFFTDFSGTQDLATAERVALCPKLLGLVDHPPLQGFHRTYSFLEENAELQIFAFFLVCHLVGLLVNFQNENFPQETCP